MLYFLQASCSIQYGWLWERCLAAWLVWALRGYAPMTAPRRWRFRFQWRTGWHRHIHHLRPEQCRLPADHIWRCALILADAAHAAPRRPASTIHHAVHPRNLGDAASCAPVWRHGRGALQPSAPSIWRWICRIARPRAGDVSRFLAIRLFVLPRPVLHSRPAAAWALLGSAIGLLAARSLGYPKNMISSGIFGFNGALTGIALGSRFTANPMLPLLGIILSALLLRLMQLAGLPALTAPFVLSTWALIFLSRWRPSCCIFSAAKP